MNRRDQKRITSSCQGRGSRKIGLHVETEMKNISRNFLQCYQGNSGKVSRPTNLVRIQVGVRHFSQKPFVQWVKAAPSDKETGTKLTIRLHLLLKLRKLGAIPPLHHTFSRTTNEVYLYIHSYRNRSTTGAWHTNLLLCKLLTFNVRIFKLPGASAAGI